MVGSRQSAAGCGGVGRSRSLGDGQVYGCRWDAATTGQGYAGVGGPRASTSLAATGSRVLYSGRRAFTRIKAAGKGEMIQDRGKFMAVYAPRCSPAAHRSALENA